VERVQAIVKSRKRRKGDDVVGTTTVDFREKGDNEGPDGKPRTKMEMVRVVVVGVRWKEGGGEVRRGRTLTIREACRGVSSAWLRGEGSRDMYIARLMTEIVPKFRHLNDEV
jgi:hypothetical protein